MCTFGDVKFYSSRAFLDDDDYDDDEIQPCTVEAKLTEADHKPFSAMLLAHSGLASEFCLKLLRSGKFNAIGRIVVRSSGASGEEELAELFGCAETLLVRCSSSRRPDSDYLLAKEVLSLCSSDCSSAVLTTEHISKLRAATGDCAECSEALRCLTSPIASTLSASVSRLPQPAFLDSVPAAVLTACTLRHQSCVTYVVYTETISTTDVSSVAPELLRALRSHDAFKQVIDLDTIPHSTVMVSKRNPIDVPDNYI